MKLSVECREKIQYYMTMLARNLVKVFWIFPIKKDRIIFCSHQGKQYSCNPRYIAEYLLQKSDGRYELIFAMKDPSRYHQEGIRFVQFFSLKHFYYFCTAHVIVDNIGFPTYMPKRKGQYAINTWHGGGAYKRSDPAAVHYTKEKLLMARYKKEKTDLVLSSSKMFSSIIPDIVYQYTGEIMESGQPRNDILVNSGRVDRQEICDRLGIDSSTLVILYAPTFRGRVVADFKGARGSSNFDFSLNVQAVQEAVEKRFQKKTTFVLRVHHGMRSFAIPGVIDASDYPDMQEILAITDILISDFSSTIWDFSLRMKPCFLYMPDLKEYIADRGVYLPVEEWPGILTQNNEELCEAILSFDAREFIEKVKHHHQALGSFETGTACEQVCGQIEKICHG